MMDAREKWLKKAMQLATIFLFEGRRTKDIASVEFGLSLEVKRLRRLAARVNPPKPEVDEE